MQERALERNRVVGYSEREERDTGKNRVARRSNREEKMEGTNGDISEVSYFDRGIIKYN